MLEAGLAAAEVDTAEAELRAAGVMRGGIVAWLAHNRREMLALLAACERLGAVLLPLNWRLAAPELARITEHAGAGWLLARPECEALADEVRALRRPVPRPADGVEPGDLLLVYTSGTTGEPRGALHTAAGMQANREAALAVQPIAPASRVLAVLPLFHVGGLCIQVLPALAAGARLMIHPRFDAEAWFEAVEQWRPSTTLLVPAVMRALVEHPRWPEADLASLEFVNSGSQVVPRALIEAFHARGVPVAQVYGATETGPVSIALPPREALAHAGLAGRPAPGVQVRLAPDGEILLRAPNLMRRYHRSAESGLDAEGWFRTGDLATLHPGGLYEVVGRSKELIISGGENIHPAEIENLLLGHPLLAECALVGLPDARWGELPVLAVVPAPGARFDAAAVLAALHGRVARFKMPRRVVVLPSLPRTALGKVQRARLAEQVMRGT